jgi:hypothetical protein
MVGIAVYGYLREVFVQDPSENKMSNDSPGPFKQFILPIIAYNVVVTWTTRGSAHSDTEPTLQSSSSNSEPLEATQADDKRVSAPPSVSTNDQIAAQPAYPAESPASEQISPSTDSTDTATSTDGNPLSNQGNDSTRANPTTDVATPPSSDASRFLSNPPDSLNSRNPVPLSGVGAIPTDANSAIDQIVAAQAAGDQPSMQSARSFLDSLPKPMPGDSDDAKRLNKLGLKDLRMKSFRTALGFFANASKDDPSSALYLSNLGYAETFAGDLDSAENHLRASLALDASRPVAWGDLALMFAKKGDQDRAISCALIGYRFSNGKTLSFLESLQQDEDPAVRDLGAKALAKLQPGQPMR